MRCFLANKNKRQVGAHRELKYDKADGVAKEGIIAARKEWGNWVSSWRDVIPPEDVPEFLRQNPQVQVIPTRWVDTDKSEVGEASKLKSQELFCGVRRSGGQRVED